MDVLWATSNLPDPTLGGGAALEHELLRQAAHHHRVTLVTGGLAPGEPVPAPLVDLGLVDVVAAGAPRRTQPGRIGTLLRSLSGPPFEFWMAGPKVAEVGRQVASRRADLVHVMWAETAPVAIAAARRGPTAFLATDAFTRHEERELALATTRRQKLYRWLQLRLTRRWERSYRGAGAVAAVSPIDAAVFEAAGVTAGVVPVVLGDDWFEAPRVTPDADLVSFIAALDYGPNQDAAAWLLDSVWPLIQAARPATTLHLVGRHPSADLRAAASAAGAVLHADVDDVRPHYWRSSVIVIPVRLGSGTRTKVLHAMASGRPVVATSAACEGLAVTAGEHLLVADDAPGLAAAVVAALDDPAAARRRAEVAQGFAAQHRADRAGEALAELWARARGAMVP
jgi:glycosyltransferase involved in cell wall biosynthesis